MINPLASERARVAATLFYGFVVLVGYLTVRVFAPFVGSLGWAAVLAVFVYPRHRELVARLVNTRAAAVSTAVVAVVIIGPGVVLATAFVQESRAAFTDFDRQAFMEQLAVVERGWDRVRGFIPGAANADLGMLVQDAMSRTGGFLAAQIGGLLADLLLLVFQLFVTLFALFFFLRDADAIMREMRRSLPFEELRRERMIRQTRDLVYASIAAGMLIASLQGLAGGIVFAALGLSAPVFWGVIMGLLALLPFFGTWVVWLPAGIWLLVTGNLTKGLALLALGGTLVASIDNILRPAILSDKTQMNGLLMFISLLGGVSVFGLIGLVLGPLVTAIAISLLEAYAGAPGAIVVAASTPSVVEERPIERVAP